MASPKVCVKCEAVTFVKFKDAVAAGWVTRPIGDGQEAWKCPKCADDEGNR